MSQTRRLAIAAAVVLLATIVLKATYDEAVDIESTPDIRFLFFNIEGSPP